jgi:D-glutamate cyclase
MRHLVIPGDLLAAARILSDGPSRVDGNDGATPSVLLILSGFPCCVDVVPPTETDGPPGTMAIARAAVTLGYDRVIVVTDDCNRAGFDAARQTLNTQQRQRLEDRGSSKDDGENSVTIVELETFPSHFSDEDERRFQSLAQAATLIVACERAGPSKDGHCYTMRGIDMMDRGLIAPLHRLVTERQTARPIPFIAIGDGGNELGMGKVIDAIRTHIERGDAIGCVVPADWLIAASVSNWGGYALAAAAALIRTNEEFDAPTIDAEASDEMAAMDEARRRRIESFVLQCLPTESEEAELVQACVAAGCRDGVSGKLEATVDGMPLERSLQCLRDVRATSLGQS